ncbi:MAG: DUF4367 domain-containing protein [Heliobacteriaceae bacterium]|nr:DUF4367 domain-containing protein [Heliobacteriaceae bacterium]
MKSNKIDILITRAVEANIDEALSREIDLDQEWSKFQRKYLPQKNRCFRQKWIAIMIPALISFGLLFGVLFPVQTKAIGLKSLAFIRTFMAGKVQTVVNDFGNKRSAGTTENSLSPEITEKIQSVPFAVLLPPDHLEEYQMNSFTVEKIGDSTDVVIKLATNDNREVAIQQTGITQGFSQGLSFDQEDADLKKIRINGQEAMLINYKKQHVSLSWIDDDVFISMDGNISEDEMCQLGTNMRKVSSDLRNGPGRR